MYKLVNTPSADKALAGLASDKGRAKQHKAVSKALRLLANDPRHPGLNSHKWQGEPCPHGDTLWEAYAENNTPGAYRIFFCYVPDPPPEPSTGPKPPAKTEKTILIVAITPHP